MTAALVGLFIFSSWIITTLITLKLIPIHHQKQVPQYALTVIFMIVAMYILALFLTNPTNNNDNDNDYKIIIIINDDNDNKHWTENKIPTFAEEDDELNERGKLFKSFIHYNDDWKAITNTDWTSIKNDDIETKFYGTKRYFESFTYDINDYPIIPYFKQSSKQRVKLIPI